MIQSKIEEVIRKELKFPDDTNIKQRGIADKIENFCNIILEKHFDTLPASSRRSVEDIVVEDCYVDHKTSDESLEFKMPNLISIDRLANLDKELIYNFVVYNSEDKKITKVFTLNVYELNWDFLTIQNLGVGQLQITNMKNFIENPRTTITREEWKTRLKKEAVKFYTKLIYKTNCRKTKWMSM